MAARLSDLDDLKPEIKIQLIVTPLLQEAA